MLVFLEIPRYKTVAFDVCREQPLEDLRIQAKARLGDAVPWESCYIAGRHGLCASEAMAATAPWLTLQRRLLGGKGGFGVTLRSQGSRMSAKPNNFDDCRDLYGRRLKTLKAAKTIIDKVESEEKGREESRERRRKKIADGLRDRPTKKHRFDDTEYIKTSEAIAAATGRATRKALREKRQRESDSSGDTGSIGSNTTPPPSSTLILPLFDGDLSSSSSSSSEGEGSGDDDA
ncbi:hypothetical protein GGF46_004064 [Coemansia sp. RSA 552]|nr:hypothetical protein GGF46_004064 [Coemansia sp. RSA 552]